MDYIRWNGKILLLLEVNVANRNTEVIKIAKDMNNEFLFDKK
jgi:hypothetical protein